MWRLSCTNKNRIPGFTFHFCRNFGGQGKDGWNQERPAKGGVDTEKNDLRVGRAVRQNLFGLYVRGAPTCLIIYVPAKIQSALTNLPTGDNFELRMMRTHLIPIRKDPLKSGRVPAQKRSWKTA